MRWIPLCDYNKVVNEVRQRLLYAVFAWLLQLKNEKRNYQRFSVGLEKTVTYAYNIDIKKEGRK